MNILLKYIITFTLVSFCSFSAARTPDGQTPAEETACDGLHGAAFGLCNAYCEAMDCDSVEANAAPQACEQVLANWESATDGATIPCEPVDGCPCAAALTSCGWDGFDVLGDDCTVEGGDTQAYVEDRTVGTGEIMCTFVVTQKFGAVKEGTCRVQNGRTIVGLPITDDQVDDCAGNFTSEEMFVMCMGQGG